MEEILAGTLIQPAIFLSIHLLNTLHVLKKNLCIGKIASQHASYTVIVYCCFFFLVHMNERMNQHIYTAIKFTV